MSIEPTNGFFNEPRYCKPGENFDNLAILPRPLGATHVCPVCEGHGKWNYQLNVLRYREDCVHPHTTHICSACNGGGWMFAPHAHVWKVVQQQTATRRLEQCTVCGKMVNIDSGD